MKLVAHFKSGPFSSVVEGLMLDDAGTYYVGGELPLHIDRIREMDKTGEIEWIMSNPLAEDVELSVDISPVKKPAVDTSEKTQRQEKDRKFLLITAVAIVVIAAAAAVMILNDTNSHVDTSAYVENVQQEIPIATETESSNSDVGLAESVSAVEQSEAQSSGEVVTLAGFFYFDRDYGEWGLDNFRNSDDPLLANREWHIESFDAGYVVFTVFENREQATEFEEKILGVPLSEAYHEFFTWMGTAIVNSDGTFTLM